jgi:hypothetical protein
VRRRAAFSAGGEVFAFNREYLENLDIENGD